ncbi:MAG TPA: glycoside hydrolase family 75 protein [Allosphingosinicella sp.]|nr:glycoside hydrolase family 75 protein [Allosphingosinicella sp.]
MKTFGSSFMAVLAAFGSVSATARAACGTDAGFSLTDKTDGGNKVRPARLLNGAILFTSQLRVDIDGAPNAYHPLGRIDGKALETICNGIAVTPHSGKHAGVKVTAEEPDTIDAEDRCQTILDFFRASRDDHYSTQGADIKWIAIPVEKPPADGHYFPCLQKGGPTDGYFVSQTALENVEKGKPCDTSTWINSLTIPYVVLPGSKLGDKVGLGDLALIYRREGGAEYVAVALAADVGPAEEVGEGSIALHRRLGNPAASGGKSGIDSGVTVFFFPGRRATLPVSDDWLQAQQQALLHQLGGIDQVRACAGNSGG